MSNPINVSGETGEGEQIAVHRRRNTQGANTVTVSVSLPKDLHQTINGIVVTDEKSRSLVITELLRAGLATYNVVLTTEEEA